MSNKLTGKVFITGRIKVETGLHIGGSKSSLDIGGVDLNVIKTPHGSPFIPGSSLKGKLRSMLARKEGSVGISKNDLKREDKEKHESGEIKIDPDFPYIVQIFGSSGDQEDDNAEITRLIVRDALLDRDHFKEKFEKKRAELDFNFSYVKWENSINRRTGTAQHPRQLERVPAGAEFDFELVYNAYDDGNIDSHRTHLQTAMEMLQDDYLGGQGSRGYGQISFKNVKVTERNINQETGTYSSRQPATEWADFEAKFQQND